MKIDPIIPRRANGTTTCQVDSHFVAPEREGGFALFAGNGQQRFTRDGNDERKRHDGQDQAGRQVTDAVRRSLEQGKVAERVLEERLDILAHQRHQSKDRQEAENHAGDRGQQLHQERAGAGQLRRRQFGKEDRGAHSQRDGNQECDEGCQHRSVDERAARRTGRYWGPKFFPSGS